MAPCNRSSSERPIPKLTPTARAQQRGQETDSERLLAGGHGDVTDLLERMTDAFIALDRDWRIIYLNGAAVRLNGKPRADTIGRSHWVEWPHTAGTEVERQYRHAMKTQRPVHFEHHYMVPGRDFWHSIHAYPDENGLSIFFRDITEQKRADDLAKLLAVAGAQFASTLDQRSTMQIVAGMALPLLGEWSCVYLVDDSGKLTDVEVAAALSEQRELLSRFMTLLPRTTTDERLPFVRAMRSSAPVLVPDADEAFYASLGQDSALADLVRRLAARSLLSVPLIARGRTIGAISFGTSDTGRRHDDRDVHAAREISLPAALALDNSRLYDAERHARRDAEEARKRAEEANRSKADFLGTMSHELRTPLNAIGGYVQLLRMGVRGPLTAQQAQDLERIERNQLHVTSLINDVLNFARLEAGRVEFDFKRVPLEKLFAELESFVAPQVAERGHELRILPCSPDIATWADSDKTMQILLNLMNNALKYTPKGSTIEVFVDDAPSTVRQAFVRICVRDAGPGIPTESQQSIFEPFVQIGRELNQPVEGIGLGLAISRDLARGMRGELTVTSQFGHGATFTLTLPRELGSSAADRAT